MFTISTLFCKAKRNGNYIVVIKMMMMMMMIMVMIMVMTMIMILTMKKQITREERKKNHRNTCNIIYPKNMVCFRYIIANTLHKGDK